MEKNSIERKIEVLEKIRDKFITHKQKTGLCFLIYLFTDYIGQIELFTFENAVKYANANPESDTKYFWWKSNFNIKMRIDYHKPLKVNDSDEYDFDNRLKFIDWMINEYKKQLENENIKTVRNNKKS